MFIINYQKKISPLTYFFLSSFIVSFNIVPNEATPCKSAGKIIFVDFPLAIVSKASKLFKRSTDSSAPASFNNLILSASACLILSSASASPSAILI